MPVTQHSLALHECSTDMCITHVIRGDEHLNNTPRQIQILKSLGANRSVTGHVPMILRPDGTKLANRHGAVSVMVYRAEGYLLEARLKASTSISSRWSRSES